MAIQFRCPGCSQPIEVDDVHAGRDATCPYCRRVVTVPAESDIGALETAEARPVSESPQGGIAGDFPRSRTAPFPPPIPAPLHVGPSRTYRDQMARTYGNYALICTSLMVLIFIATVLYSGYVFMTVAGVGAATQSTQPAVDVEKIMIEHPSLIAGSLGSLFFGVVGLALGITSVKQSTRENWRGILSLVICGLFVLTFCVTNTLGIFVGLPA